MKTQLSYEEFKARSRFDKDELIGFAKGTLVADARLQLYRVSRSL